MAAAVVLQLGLASASGAEDFPRRHDGRPDFEGTYDSATLTPLQRPEEWGDRLTLSPEEAQAFAQRWRDNLASDDAPSDPDREAPPKGGVDIYVPEFNAAAGKVGGYNAGFVDIGDNTFQIDGQYRTSIITDPPDGRRPRRSALGREIAKAREVMRHENTGTAWWFDLEQGPYDDPELRPLGERCVLSRSRSGPPSLPAMYNNLKRIVQTDDHLMILNEQMHDARIIPIGGEIADDLPPQWMGDSVGRWDGDALVIETTNFLESVSEPQTRRTLHVVERLSRMDGENLLYEFTVTDPLYETSWSGEYPWPLAQGRLYEYACHEGNYSFFGIMKGARLLENEERERRARGSSGGF